MQSVYVKMPVRGRGISSMDDEVAEEVWIAKQKAVEKKDDEVDSAKKEVCCPPCFSFA